jgi:truncated hemoglobin YjbI
MESRPDIASKSDVKVMLDTFYEKVVLDPLIGPFFTEIEK